MKNLVRLSLSRPMGNLHTILLIELKRMLNLGSILELVDKRYGFFIENRAIDVTQKLLPINLLSEGIPGFVNATLAHYITCRSISIIRAIIVDIVSFKAKGR